MSEELIRATGRILEELFNFDGQLEELCTMSEIEGEFGMDAGNMLTVLKDFIEQSQKV